MKFCGNCGTKLPEGSVVCPNCGASVNQGTGASQDVNVNQGADQNADYAVNNAQPVQNSKPPVQSNDNGSVGWGFLGFCIPIVGLVLFIVWKDEKPKSSKAAGIGALISVIAVVVIYILIFAIGMGSYMFMY